MPSFIPALFSIHGAKGSKTPSGALFPWQPTLPVEEVCPALRQSDSYFVGSRLTSGHRNRAEREDGSLGSRFWTQLAAYAVHVNNHGIKSNFDAGHPDAL